MHQIHYANDCHKSDPLPVVVSQSRIKGIFPKLDISHHSGRSNYITASSPIVSISKSKGRLLKRFVNEMTSISTEKNILSVDGVSVHKSSTNIQLSRKVDDRSDGKNNNKKSGDVQKMVCLEGCRYDVVRRCCLELGLKEVPETDYWNILWTDSPLSAEKAADMRRLQTTAYKLFWGPYFLGQKTNHFPGMLEICRKDRLARNLNRMRRLFADDFDFFPESWTLPVQVGELLQHFRRHKNQTYICKPDSGCQGKGIFLVRNLKKINPFTKLISQVYISNPLLIDGYKFDLRIYILVTSCDPLRIYIYNEGIARFATVKYSPPNEQNVDVVFMHLTNYSLNKFSQSYMPEPEGSKRKLSTIYGYLVEKGFDVEKMIEDIDDVIIKTMMSAHPTLRHYYRASFPPNDAGSSCFELLGFDILLDENLKPWLLEVNLSPSFNLDLAVDAEIKETLLKDTINKIYVGPVKEKRSADISQTCPKRGVVNLQPPNVEIFDKAGNTISPSLQRQFYHEQLNQGNYRLVYPTENCRKYSKYLDPALNTAPMYDLGSPYARQTSLCSDQWSNNDDASVLPIPPSDEIKTDEALKPIPQILLDRSCISKTATGTPESVENLPGKVRTGVTSAVTKTVTAKPLLQRSKTVKKTTKTPNVTKSSQQTQNLKKKKDQPKRPNDVPDTVINKNDGLNPINLRIGSNSQTIRKNECNKSKNPSVDGGMSCCPDEEMEMYSRVSGDQNPPSIQQQSPSANANAKRKMNKTKLVEEWLLGGYSDPKKQAIQPTRDPDSSWTGDFRAWTNFIQEEAALKKMKDGRSRNSVVSTAVPNLMQEESERKKLLIEREKKIRQLGIEGKIFQMMKRTGKLTLEEELLYDKVFSDDLFKNDSNSKQIGKVKPVTKKK